MISDSVFRNVFLISVAVHGVILLQNPHLLTLPQNIKPKDTELVYVKVKQPPEVKKLPGHTAPRKDEPFLKTPAKIVLENKKIPPPFVDKQDIFQRNKENMVKSSVFNKPVFVQPDIIAVKKKINLPAVDLDKVSNPSYVGYYQIIREKIRRYAYRNYGRIETGEVYISFIISRDGYLMDARIRGDKSSATPYLKEIALRSLKDSSPFPVFPEELDYPQLSFNVIISFETE